MKALVFFLLTSILLVSTPACQKESKYAAEISTVQEATKLFRSVGKDLDKMTNRVNFGKALINFVLEYKRLRPELLALEDKFPNLQKNDGENTVPADLKPYVIELQESQRYFRTVMNGKMVKWRRDEELNKIINDVKDLYYFY